MIFDLVVLGASWGGLHAVQVVLGALPAHFLVPLALVQHREKAADETLTGLLQNHCALLVAEAEDKLPILPGHVYLAPPDYHLLIDCGLRNSDFGGASSAVRNPKSETGSPQSEIRNHFALSTDEPVNYARPSIDVLFESAANAYDERTIGVILTGTSQDGARGLAAIKRHGGLTVVQDPATAEAPTMPNAAIALGVVDRVLPLEGIGGFLVEEIGQRMRNK